MCIRDSPQNPDRDDLYWPSMASPENTDDVFGAPGPDEEFLDDWLVRTCELIDRYRPRILYFDWWIQHANAKPYLKKLAAYYYNRAAEWGVEVAIDYKHDAFLFGTAVPDIERGQMEMCIRDRVRRCEQGTAEDAAPAEHAEAPQDVHCLLYTSRCV